MTITSKTRMPQSMVGELPQKLFGYDIVDFIGEGAGSLIYVVSHPDSKQIYAMKHVVRRTEKCERFFAQLENEYEVSRHFTHRGLRRAISLHTNKTIFRKATEAVLILEMVDGVPLEAKRLRYTLDTVVCFINVAKALEAMHDMGYVHCDLKPNNILRCGRRDIRIIDFGQACKTGTVKERIQGTPDFISPEQVKRDPVSPRTDIFNFGATLYWTLANRAIPTLFTLSRSENSFLLDDAIQSPHDVNPKVPETLSNLVMECIRTNPMKRPEAMKEVIRRLEIIQHGLARGGNLAFSA